jgi:hypothetical protein
LLRCRTFKINYLQGCASETVQIFVNITCIMTLAGAWLTKPGLHKGMPIRNFAMLRTFDAECALLSG